MSQLPAVLELLVKSNHVGAKAIVRLSEAASTQRKIHLIIRESCHVIVMVIARIIPVNAECEVFGIWLQLRAVVLLITLSSQMN